MTGPLLKLEHVAKTYESAGSGTPVLRGVDLEVEAGSTLAVVGPSGCGKSTLLNIIGTLDRPSSGTVTLEGEDVFALDERRTARIRNAKIGFVFQLHHLLPQCSVLENVLVPTIVGGRPGGEVVERARRLLERVGLSERLTHRPGQLSGGECQRVAVVRALINKPALLLADEPTGSLDHAAAEKLVELLAELNREEGVTLILVTHAPDLASRMGLLYELMEGSLHLKS